MKYFLIVVSLCLAVCQAYAQTEFHGVVAHRAGIWDDPELPENSIAALNKSAAIGVDVIEIDVHLSKDHIVVVNHDHDFKGMDIATHTYQELKAHGRLSNGETLPTLGEYIQAIQAHDNLRLWVDIKRSNVNTAWDILAGEYVGKTITENRAADVAEVIAPMFTTMVRIKQVAPEVKLHYIGTEYSPEAIGLLGFDGINLGYKRYKEEYNLKELQDSGLKSGAYVIDDPAIMRDFLDKKIDYITTNKPQVLLDLIAR